LLRMQRITIRRALTWHYRKMHPCVEQSDSLVPLSLFPSWQGCITNTSGYDFRKGQVPPLAPAVCQGGRTPNHPAGDQV
jgi:hypothetical protein